ncbi:unnamed protein product [Zymoseptoria tritici ST99CH_1A5]|uniref:Uncharacterized protein n=1 Tax=Zymoseptoria tritici ST99CH_1A5 TaxID=1276529 RepID=A0A1Y6LH36_ZYMTR|nr:unnamed protein product [Zymoseptoria tritici ST99CH_1A5]
MPKYRGFSIFLKSQYDALTIPEFVAPPSIFETPPRRLQPPTDGSSSAPPKDSPSTPKPPRISTVYVPIYPGSQFWIHYACPVPDGHVSFYYFKLFVRGQCLLSWGVGEENDFQGRLAFGVYDGGQDFQGRQVLEKRAFFFPTTDVGARRSGSFELRVYRSRARKREPPKYEKFKMSGDEKENGFSIATSGRMRKGEPKRMYTYALLDPIDQPYATFKYNFRTGNQLRELGITLPSGVKDIDDIMSTSPDRRDPSPVSPMTPQTLSPPVPRREYAAPRQPDFGPNAKAMHPLSLPPRMRFSPVKTRPDREAHPSPVKKNVPRPESPVLGNLSAAPTLRKSRLPMRSPMMKLDKPLPEIKVGRDEETEAPRACQVPERGINALDARDWNSTKVSRSTDVEYESQSNPLMKSFNTAIRSLKRRVGSREETRLG